MSAFWSVLTSRILYLNQESQHLYIRELRQTCVTFASDILDWSTDLLLRPKHRRLYPAPLFFSILPFLATDLKILNMAMNKVLTPNCQGGSSGLSARLMGRWVWGRDQMPSKTLRPKNVWFIYEWTQASAPQPISAPTSRSFVLIRK